VYRPSAVPSCTKLCSALSAALSAGSSGSELMKSGSDSREVSGSLNEGGCGPVTMLHFRAKSVRGRSQVTKGGSMVIRWSFEYLWLDRN